MRDLTTMDREDLAIHEATIEHGLMTFVEVGSALAQIRVNHLYGDYRTFEAYCHDRWRFSKTHANRLIDASTVAIHLAPIGVGPTNEAQARALTTIRRDDGAIDLERAGKAWSMAVSEAKKRGARLPTAANVEKLVTRWKNSQRTEDIELVEGEEPPDEQLPIDHAVDPVAGECQQCGSYERDADNDCANCRDPFPDGIAEERGEEEEPSGNPAFEALKEAVAAWRDLYPGIDDATSAAMCENVADLIREAMNS